MGKATCSATSASGSAGHSGRAWWDYQQAPSEAELLAQALALVQAAYQRRPTCTLGVTADRLAREVRRAEEGER